MTWPRILLVPLVVAALAPSAPAGIFSRKTKPNPAERVPELLIQLKSGHDEGQRLAAADELRQYDPKSYPEIVTGLIDALGRDASPAVRAEAASSLGRLRPISQQAGVALEQSQTNDAIMKVRLAARQSLWQYHLVGYRGGKAPDAPATGGQDNSQPQIGAMPRVVAQPTSRGTPSPRHPGAVRESPEPPLAVPPTSNPQVSRPPQVPIAPVVPTNPGLMPIPKSDVTNAGHQPSADRPLPAAGGDGPALPPPE
jgi:hypothetical protein